MARDAAFFGSEDRGGHHRASASAIFAAQPETISSHQNERSGQAISRACCVNPERREAETGTESGLVFESVLINIAAERCGGSGQLAPARSCCCHPPASPCERTTLFPTQFVNNPDSQIFDNAPRRMASGVAIASALGI